LVLFVVPTQIFSEKVTDKDKKTAEKVELLAQEKEN
jgi:hypothetical protein